MLSKGVGLPEKRVYCVAKSAQAAGPASYYEKYTDAFHSVATCDSYGL